MAFGLHDEDVMTSVRGAAFIAPPETLITPTLLKQFTTEVDSVGTGEAAFLNLGHLAEDTLPEFASDGGDPTSKNTWNKKGLRTVYADTTATVTLHMVQGGKDLITLLYNGVAAADGGVDFTIEKKAVNKSLFILLHDTDTDEKGGFLIPNIDLSYSSLPTLNQDAFNQYDVLGTFKPSTALTKNNGKSSYVRQYFPADFSK